MVSSQKGSLGAAVPCPKGAEQDVPRPLAAVTKYSKRQKIPCSSFSGMYGQSMSKKCSTCGRPQFWRTGQSNLIHLLLLWWRAGIRSPRVAQTLMYHHMLERSVQPRDANRILSTEIGDDQHIYPDVYDTASVPTLWASGCHSVSSHYFITFTLLVLSFFAGTNTFWYIKVR